MIEGQKPTFEFGEFRLDVMKRQLWRNGQVVPLYSKAFDLLLVLAQNGGNLLTKDELLETVWPGQILEEANLTVTMSAVRKALGEKAAQPRFIVTIPGRGYRFVADLRPEPAGVVIESETISQITVEEDSDADERELAAPAVKLIAGSESRVAGPGALERAPYANALTLPARQSRSFFSRPVVSLSLLIFLAALVAAGIYEVRTVRQQRLIAGRFAQTKATSITNTGLISNASISPDGQFFAFVQCERGKDHRKCGLHLGQINGERRIELVPPTDASYFQGLQYAVDGSALYFTTQGRGQTSSALYRISVLGGIPAKLRDNIGGDFSLAPDQRRVAFIVEDTRQKTRSLVISNLDGSSEKALLTLSDRAMSLRAVSWSPDGSVIAAGIARNPGDSNLSLVLISTNNGEQKDLTTPLWRDITRALWLNDGSGLMLIAASKDPREGRQVWYVTYPGGEARRITNDLSLYDRGLSVGRDPNTALLVQLQQINNIWAGPADDFSRARQITFTTLNTSTGNFAFDWLPDGRILYASSQGRALSLSLMDADGQHVKEVTSPGNFDAYPSVTGDGRFVVFHSTRSGSDEIWRAETSGNDPKQLTTCGQNMQPGVSPDGKWVVYISACDGSGGLWRLPLAGGTPQRLTDKRASWPWVSPDSKWIACGYESTPDKWQLAIIPIEGGPPAKLFDVPPQAAFNFAVRWAPDGKSVSYRDWSLGLWRQSIAGGAPQQIPGLPEDKIYCYGWSRDGKLFAYSRGVEMRDVVLLRNSN